MMLVGRMDSSEIRKPEGYFSPPPLRLVVLSLCTFHAYEFYWFYKNWKYTGERFFWLKTILSPFLAYQLFKKVDHVENKAGLVLPVPIVIPAGFYLLLIMGSLLPSMPQLYQITSFFSFLPLLVVNNLAIKINKRRNPDYVFVGLSVYKWLLLAPLIILIEGCLAWGYIYFSRLPV